MRARILIVDDDPDIVLALENRITWMGFTPISRTSYCWTFNFPVYPASNSWSRCVTRSESRHPRTGKPLHFRRS